MIGTPIGDKTVVCGPGWRSAPVLHVYFVGRKLNAKGWMYNEAYVNVKLRFW